MTWRNKKFQNKFPNTGESMKVGSTHKPSNNLVVPIIISLDRPLLGSKLMSLN